MQTAIFPRRNFVYFFQNLQLQFSTSCVIIKVSHDVIEPDGIRIWSFHLQESGTVSLPLFADLACTENAADKEAAIRVAIKKVDQACAKGLLHKNAAARKKSQLAKKLNAAD